MGGAECKPVGTTSVDVVRGSERQRYLKQKVMEHIDDDEDFYSLFGLEPYCDIDSETKGTITSQFKKSVLKWHPDKNPPEKRLQCTIVTEKIVLAKKVFLTPDLKRRYDRELRAMRDGCGYSHWDMFVRWGWTVLSGAAGVTCIVAGACTANPALSVAGSTLLGSSMATGRKNFSDPHCSNIEFTKDLILGSLIGVATGGIGAGAGVAMEGASLLMCASTGSCAGAASYATAHAIRDAADLAMTELGLTRPDRALAMISDVRSRSEIFTADNFRQFAEGTAICFVVGGVLSVGAAKIGAAPGDVVDDGVQLITRQEASQAARSICGAISVHGSSDMYHLAAEAVKCFSTGVIQRLLPLQSFARFMMGRGVVRYHPSKQVVGLWSDSTRTLVVEVDLSVKFERSELRDVSSLHCSSTTWCDNENCLKFDVTFPPDASNPDGRAHWCFYTDGSVKVSFDREMPNGKLAMEFAMTREPFRIAGIWEDETRRLRVSEDRKQVDFLWSRVRDVSKFETKRITWDPNSRCFRFDLLFPKDAANPDGLAHWELSETGDVAVSFDNIMPNGCQHSRFKMQRQKVSPNWLDRFRQ